VPTLQNRLADVLAHLDVSILVEDPSRHILHVNQPFCDLFHIPVPPSELIGRNCAAMARASAEAFAEPEAFLAIIEATVASTEPVRNQRLRMADGRWLEVDFVPHNDGINGHTGHAWLYRDITRQANAEAAVRASESELLALLDGGRDPLWSVDLRLRMIHFNQAFRDLCRLRTGWSPVEGAPVELSVPGGLHHRELGAYREVLAGGTHEFVMELPASNGARMLEVLLAPIRTDGRVTGVVATGRDVTQDRRTSRLLREARDAAEAASSAKSDFLAHISHELRTPLNAMIGMVDLTLETHLDARQRSYLQSAQANSEALLDLISDVLDFSKIEAGEMDLDRSPFDPREVVEEVLQFLGTQALQKGLTLSFHTRDVPARILGDYQRYRQVALNLVGNAIKYTEEGRIDVSLTASRADEGAALCLRVVDTGIGIAAADQERVFTRFARSHSARRTSGTGLGLSITARLAELMGGRITLESALGEGSSFSVVIPVHELPATTTHPLAGVLVVATPDDVQRERWGELGASLGLQVHSCRNGADIAEAVLRHRDVVCAVVVADGLHGPPIDKLRTLTAGVVDRPVPWLWVSGDLQAGSPDPAIAVLHRPLLRTTLRRALQAPTDADAAVDLRRGARIFVAEDHADSRRFMVDSLRRDGHDAVAWEDGEVAREPLLQRGYDLALLDLDMPGHDGLELTAFRRAWEEETGAPRLPIVMVSGHATEDHRRRAQEAGVDAFVPKPLTRQRLLGVVDRILDLRPTVLVADDASEARRLWTIWLRQAGANVVEATHGQEAVALAAEHRPDAIVLDMEMPVLDGYGAATQLRRTGSDVPILGFTGHIGSAARRRVLEAGCTAYLAKPVRRSALLEALRGLMWAGTQTDTAPTIMQAPDPVDDLGELVPLYLEERSADVVRLREAVHAQAWDEIRAIGHRMKGTAVPYGFPEVEVVGRALESAAAAADAASAASAIARLDQLLREARTTSSGSTRP